jgi:hypothetical protein
MAAGGGSRHGKFFGICGAGLDRSQTIELRRDRFDGEAVDQVVHRIAAVALDPPERHVTGAHQLDQGLPQVGVGDGLLLGVLPAVAFPLDPPAVAEAVHDVGRVRHDLDRHGRAVIVGERCMAAKGVEHGVDLHALVGRVLLAARSVRLAARGDRPRPPARPGVPAARAIGVDRERRHRPQPTGG